MGQTPDKNGLTSVLTTLASSGDNWVKLGTLGLVALSGFSNWVATWNSSDRNKQEIEVSRRVAYEGEQRIREDVRKQVAEIHMWLDQSKTEFHRSTDDAAANRRMLERLSAKLLPDGDQKNQ